MTSDELCPSPLRKDDAAALIGIVARLHGESLTEQLDPDLRASLAGRLWREGLAATPDAAGLHLAFDGLVERLREALGEQVE